MKLLKAHLLLVICGVVVLLALGSLYWPFGAWKDEIKQKMEDRLQRSTRAITLATAKTTLPGPGNAFVGPVTRDLVDHKDKLQKGMQRQADAVAKLVSNANQRGRVVQKNGHLVPLMAGMEQPDYLPAKTNDASPNKFRDNYVAVSRSWLNQLGADMPPTQEEVAQAATDYLKRRAANAPRVLGQNLNPTEAAMSTKETDEFKRNYIINRARAVRLYASPDCFQRRPWASLTAAPNEDQIFEAIVDCWIMQDIVNAILAMNKDSQMVEYSPVKRLGIIAIGSGASGANVGGFPTAKNTSAGQANFAGSTGAGLLFLSSRTGPAKIQGIDPTRSLTGRVGTERFDVTHVQLSLHIEASALNQFIRELYLQSNAYTVLNMRFEVVDPLDASSQGYLYGKVPVVRADILMEAVFFRGWTLELMPEKTKTQLGIAATPTP